MPQYSGSTCLSDADLYRKGLKNSYAAIAQKEPITFKIIYSLFLRSRAIPILGLSATTLGKLSDLNDPGFNLL
jgi:hypothetical protein